MENPAMTSTAANNRQSAVKSQHHPARTILLATLLAIVLAIPTKAHSLPTYQQVKAAHKNSDAILLDRHGEVIYELRVDPTGRKLQWTAIKDMSPALVSTIINSEDRRFYGHSGVDWAATATALLKNTILQKKRGASTITMQLASLLDKKLRPKGATRRTLPQKWDQMSAAREMESTWTKDQILETYLNLITFKGELQGISAAARGLFDKEPSGLDQTESLILAALIRSPNAPIQATIRRASSLATAQNSKTTPRDIQTLAEQTLARPYAIRQRTTLAPHVAHLLLKNGATSVSTTLDARLQRFVTEALTQQITVAMNKNVNQGAAIVVENKTGDILAYVASIDSPQTAFVDGIQARRQAGSTLKPFLYGLAFDKHILTPASLMKDSPLDIPTAYGIYRPEDYATTFNGIVSARTALASSLNIPAVRTLSLVGVDSFLQTLGLLGFTGLRQDEHYGLSLALGTVDISLYELVNAYRTLANGGQYNPIRMTPQPSKTKPRQALSKKTVFLVSSILSDRNARSLTFGLENPLSTRYWTAVKTGTSKDMRDNWCIGYSQKYTVGVWVGNFTGEPMWNVSGITGAAPVWLEIMNHLSKTGTPHTPQPPQGITSEHLTYDEDIEAPREEWFIKGTENGTVTYRPQNVLPRIIYPARKTVIAMDPDIPEDRQRIFFETNVTTDSFTLVLDGTTIGNASNPAPWPPLPGNHTVSLLDDKQNTVDSIRFMVKGAIDQHKDNNK